MKLFRFRRQWKSKVVWESENANFTGDSRKVTAKCDNGNMIAQIDLAFTAPTPEPDSPPIGAIVGGVIGGLVVIAVIVVVVVLYLRKRKAAQLESHESSCQETEETA